MQEIGSTVVKNSKKIVQFLEVIQRLKSSINEHEIWVNTKIIFNVLVFVKSLAQKCGRKVKKSLVQLALKQFPHRIPKTLTPRKWVQDKMSQTCIGISDAQIWLMNYFQCHSHFNQYLSWKIWYWYHQRI